MKPEDSDLIFDVGAHEGEDSEFYLKLGFRVVAIEANPRLAEKLQSRFRREIEGGRFSLVSGAVAASAGSVEFHVNKVYSAWGTASREWADRNRLLGAESDQMLVEGIRFVDVIRRHGCPHYLKIDIEGADMLCVSALHDLHCRPKYISIESTKTSWSGLISEFDALESLGYSRFKVVNQSRLKGGQFRGRDSKLVKHEFEYGATGAFGEYLADEWLTKKQAIRRYVWVFATYRVIGDNTFLERIVRRIPFVRRLLGHVPWYDTHAMRE